MRSGLCHGAITPRRLPFAGTGTTPHIAARAVTYDGSRYTPHTTMKKHTIPLLALAGVCSAGVLFSELLTAQEPSAPVRSTDIVAVASGNPDFSTLVSALRAADLVAVLQSKGPFTVFAPNNAAFAKLPPGALEDLLKPENKKKLAGILKNHVAEGKIMAADVKDGRIRMLNGDRVEVAVENGNVGFGGAKVLRTDLPASNGVIHVIDAVVMPD